MLNKKHIILFLIMVLGLVVISSVSATDFGGDAAANASFEEAEIDDVLGQENGDDSDSLEAVDSNSDNVSSESNRDDAPLSASSNKGTFTELQNKINNAPKGSTIYLDKDYYYNKDFGGENGIKITKPITIDGKGHTIDGKEKSALLLILKTNNVVLKNIVFKNGFIYDLGSVGIFYSNNVKFNKCRFESNYATDGGAVFLAYSTYTSFSYCEFNSNSADNGGALYLAHTDASFDFCSFNENFADFGGAIFLDNCKSSSFDACIFDENAALNNAAAVYLENTSSSFDSCSFTNNVLSDYLNFKGDYINEEFWSAGGAIFSTNSILNILDCDFYYNCAGMGGGDVCSQYSMVFLSGSSFYDSYAYGFGGSLSFNNDYADIRDCHFDDCYSIYHGGGAIYCLNSIVNSYSTSYVDCFSYYGGAVCSINTELDIQNNIFDSNRGGSVGGSIYAIYGSLNVVGSTFSYSYAMRGGAMYISSPHMISNISNNRFLYCSGKVASKIYIDSYYGEIPEMDNIYEDLYFVYATFTADLNETSVYEANSSLLTYIISNSNTPQSNWSHYDDLRMKFVSNIAFNDSNILFDICDEDYPSHPIIFLTYDNYNNTKIAYDFDNLYKDYYDSSTVFEANIYNFNGELLDNLRIASHTNLSKIEGIDANFSYITYYSIMHDDDGCSLYPISDDENITVFDKYANRPYFWIWQINPDEFNHYKIKGKFSFTLKDTQVCYNYGNILESNTYSYAVAMFNPNYPVDSIDSYYDSRDYGYVTPVKNQGVGSNCWAFAGIATLEACLKKLTNHEYDFSENNAKNLMATSSIYGLNIDSNVGGYDSMFMSYLTSWLGPIDDEYDEYNPSSFLSIQLWSTFHIQNIAFLSPRAGPWDNDEFKRAIMDCGAVAVTINWTDEDGFKGFHSISLVGWNDDYNDIDSLGNYASGAWIFKNSWGDWWGDDGYGYLSYDQNLSGEIAPYMHAYTFVFSDGDVGYQDIYQYDFAGFTDYILSDADSVYYKNRFTARDDEFLYAFSTYFEKPAYFTFSIRINGEDITKDDNGNAIEESIHYSPAGYHTIPLGYNLTLKCGDEFEIIIRLLGNGGKYVPVCQADELYRLSYSSNVSFISYNGRDWFDLYDLKTKNRFAYGGYKEDTCQVACIKAFTTLWREGSFKWVSRESEDMIFDTSYYDVYKINASFPSCDEKSLSFYCAGLALFPDRDDYVELKVNGGDEIYYLKIDNGTAHINFDDWENGYYKCSAQIKSNFFTSNPLSFDIILADMLYAPFSQLAEIIANASEGATITLDKNYCWDANFNEPYILINKSLTIDGANHTLNGASKSGIFKILSNCNVTLKNIRFMNGNSYGEFGAIFSNGTLTVSNCTFSDNSADFGGAIYSLGECFVEKSVFNNNRARYFGGAIYSRNLLNITDSEFQSFEDTEAVYFGRDENRGDLYLRNNKMFSGTTNGATVMYDADEKYSSLPLHLVFTTDFAVKGEYVNLCRIVDDEGNTFRLGDVNVTLAGQNGDLNIKVGYSHSLGGYAFDTSMLDYGTYKLTGSVSGNCTVKDGTLYVVKKSVLNSSGLSKVYGKTNELTVTLKEDNGNAFANDYVYVKLNDETIKIKTNSAGQASLPVKLAPKTYTATISYAGNENYSSASIKVKVVIKKATPKITAYKKTFNLKTKTKKYTITLKNNLGKVMKNKKVTIKVNGKTYTAKTNSKGKATFKITKLNKKGSYKATVKFAGNKYYKSVTKKVTIAVKK